MSFLTPALTAGAVLIALPIILHLVMRRQPTPMVFPALRFVQKRRSSNQTRLRLRHWILLALRCAAVGLLAFALARPVLKGSGLKGGETGLVSIAMVVDNSPRMGYRDKNQTRLEAAKELGGWLIEQLPGDSRVAVVATGGARGKRLGDRDAAQLRLMRMGVSHRTRPLEAAVRDAIDLLAEREGDRREAYVFTDLSVAAWSAATRSSIAAQLDRLEGVSLFVVDVGAERAVNLGLGAVRLSSGLLAVGQPLTIDAEAYSTEATAKPVVAELWVDAGGKPEKRAQSLIDLSTAPAGEAAFTLASLGEGVHQGYLRIADADPLEADNTRYFTVRVEPPRPVLLVGVDRPATLFVDQALAPLDAAGGEASVYETERITFDRLGQTRLDDYRTVWLLDPPPLDGALWRRLDSYARGGGSVAVALGRNVRGVAAFNTPAPQAILAGPLKWKSRDATYLRPARYDQPALEQLADFAEIIPWSAFPVFRYWVLDSLGGDASSPAVVVASFANGDPAIIERPVGRGRVVTITTPLSDPASGFAGGGGPWNLLPTGQDPWPFLALARNLADHLSGAAERRWNYAAGQPAVLPVPTGAGVSSYVLRLPTGESIKSTRPPGAEIVVGATDTPGNYRLLSGGAGARLDTGFSVNGPADIGRLERIAFDEIQTDLGADRVTLARGQAELAREVDVGRVGRELYPWLIALVAAAMGAEHLMSNRFYKEIGG